jgi:hypothetical protein
MSELKEKAAKLEKFKYPLIVLVLGVILMLVPTKSSYPAAGTTDSPLQTVLTRTKGVGDAVVIVSENGVVVVCEGADNAKVRLDILRAVSSYTGFGSDKITILKMKQSK